MLRAKSSGTLFSLQLPHPLCSSPLNRRRSALLAVSLLTAGLVALLLWAPGPAQAQDGEPPPVANLRCIVGEDVAGFFWAVPQWPGGEVDSYDYELRLPDGKTEGARTTSTSLVRRGAYQPGKEARLSIETNYETAGGRTVSSAAEVLVCYVEAAPPQDPLTPTPTATPTSAQDGEVDHAALIAQMYQWRDDPCCASDKAHTDRWDRALLAFGETVADTTLSPMTADEAQEFADRGWTRWVEVAEALRDIESGAQQSEPQQVNRAPTVSSALPDATIVNESGTRTVSLSGVFSDPDNDALTITAASSDDAVATDNVASDGSMLTVNAQAQGEAEITVTADDGNGGTALDTFTVRVKAAPVVSSALADVTGLAAGATQEVSLSGVFGDADGDALTITAQSSDDAIATVTAASDGSTLTVAAVAEGTATVTVIAQDPDGNRVLDDFDVAVAAEPTNQHAALIAQMYEWRNDPRYASVKAHTDRWDRALLAFGETVADTTLSPMTAAEAQAFADRGWTRWVEVAKALQEMESGEQEEPPMVSEEPEYQPQMQEAPGPGDTVWSATLTVNTKSEGRFTTGRFTDCDDEYGPGCNSFTYKGGSYVVTGLSLHNGYYGLYSQSITMKFWKPNPRKKSTYIDYEPNLLELGLRIDDVLLSITEGIRLLNVDFTVWKNPGISWTAGDEVSVSLEVLTPRPTGVTVTPGDEELVISWTAPTVPDGTTITGYEVRHHIWNKSKGYEDPIATGSTSTEYTLTGLTNGVRHSVQVRATHNKGHGAWAFPAGGPRYNGFRSTPVGPAYAPSDLRTYPSDRGLLVEWTMDPRRNGGSPVTGYQVHYTSSTTVDDDAAASGMDPAAGWIDSGDTGADTMHWVSGLANDTAYRVRVRAVNQHGNGEWSEAAEGIPFHPAPLFDLRTADIRRDGKPGLRLTYRLDPEARPVEVIAQVIDPNRYSRVIFDERAPGGREVVWPVRGVNHLLPAGASISCANDPSSPGVGHCEVTGLPPLDGIGVYHTRVYARDGNVLSPTSLFVPKWYQPYNFHPAVAPGYGLMSRDND